MRSKPVQYSVFAHGPGLLVHLETLHRIDAWETVKSAKAHGATGIRVLVDDRLAFGSRLEDGRYIDDKF